MTTIKLKNGSGAPTAGDLAQGEPALDLTNKRLYTEDSGGTVIEVGTNPTSVTTGDITATGTATFAGLTTTANVTFGDNNKAIFGVGSDLQIYHDGSNSYVKDAGDGVLNVQGSSQVNIGGANGTIGVQFVEGANVTLRHNNSPKLATTSTGVDVSGEVEANTAHFGTGTGSGPSVADEVVVSGTSSTGLTIHSPDASNATLAFGSATDNDYAFVQGFYNSGSPFLRFSIQNSEKAKVTSTGIDVTGTVTADGLTVDGTATFTTADNSAQVTLVSTDTDALVGPQLNLWRNSGTGTNGDLIGEITFTGEDTVGSTNTFATISAVAEQTNNGAEDGALHFKTLLNGTLANRLSIGTVSSGGDISFYEDTGTTAKLFWDASAESLTVPVLYLDDGVFTSGLAGSASVFNEDGTTADFRVESSGNTHMLFVDGGTNNVGIGTSSPSSIITAVSGSSADETVLTIANDYSTADAAGDASGLMFQLYRSYASSLNDAAFIKAEKEQAWDASGDRDSALTFGTRSGGAEPTEHMRLDSSGNLLVGTTTTDPNLTAGAQLSSNGRVLATVDGSNAGYFNRLTSDGELVRFEKDGNTVGSIGTVSSDLYIGEGAVNIRFDGENAQILPLGSGGASSNGVISLGGNGAAFKDLYLSGGAYLGGTGSANKLDDYEEGTFTPTLGGGTSFGTTTYTTQTGTYTKIGDTVHLRIYLDVSATTGSGFLKIGGIPFTVASLGSIGAFLPSGLNWGGGSYLQSYAAGGDGFLRIYYATDNANWQAQQITNETQQMLITIAYQVA